MGRSGLFILIVIVLMAIGGYVYFSSQNQPAAAVDAATSETTAPAVDSGATTEAEPYGVPAGEATSSDAPAPAEAPAKP